MRIGLHTATISESCRSQVHRIQMVLNNYSDLNTALPVTIAEYFGTESSETGAPNPASLATRALLQLERAVAELREEMARRGLLDEGVRL